MSQFIYFTPEEKARAQNTDLVSLLRAQGERPVRSGREFRTPNDPSITVRGNKWFDHSARVGGYAVSFVQRYRAAGACGLSDGRISSQDSKRYSLEIQKGLLMESGDSATVFLKKISKNTTFN